MSSFVWYWFLMLWICIMKWSNSQETVLCPSSCICDFIAEDFAHLTCNNSEKLLNSSRLRVGSCKQNFKIFSSTFKVLQSHKQVKELTINCLNETFIKKYINLSKLAITDSNLRQFPYGLVKRLTYLKLLNLSRNHLEDIPHMLDTNLSLITTLDLSYNELTEILWVAQFSHLKELFVQGNNIIDFSGIYSLEFLDLLDVSNNPISFKNSKLNTSHQITQLYLQSVTAVQDYTSCSEFVSCMILPPNLKILDLSNNNLSRIPSCDGLLYGLQKLEILYLETNNIATIDGSMKTNCYANLKFLSFHSNQLVQVDSSFFLNLNKLDGLVFSNNFLQHISVSVIKHFDSILSLNSSENERYKKGLQLDNNFWSCDCFQINLHKYLKTEASKLSIVCKIPDRFQGIELKNLNSSDLICTNASISVNSNVSVVSEFDDAILICNAHGLPKPLISWTFPDGTLMFINSTPTNHNQFSLSHFGERLMIKDVRLSKTGIFRCIANNTVSIANDTIGLGVVLNNVSTIIYLVIACVTFMVAVILNSANMCMYIYEHVKAKREYKRAIEQQKKEEKMNPPIRHRSRSVMDDSIASLNANRHYGKYDFTCQQMFLDTVIKGAHSFKKTFHDAKHSEFSTNMWEYAASLRERLHIELPTQLPTISMPSISMPSISMPTISMPSIPTMQEINTNIEKLGTSVMNRSHNLATSVGSVFTLRRWAWQNSANNSSDDESKSSDENLEKSGISSVKVDIHVTDPESEVKCSIKDDTPHSSKHEKRESRKIFSRFLSNRNDVEVTASRSSKSLPNYKLSRQTSENKEGWKKPIKTVSFLPQENKEIFVQPITSCKEVLGDQVVFPEIKTVSLSVENAYHSYETSL